MVLILNLPERYLFPQINSSSNLQLKIIEKRIISNSTYDFSDSFKETFEDECHIFLKDEIYLKISKDTITFELCSELSEIHFSKRIVNMAIPMLFVLNDFMVLHASSVNLDNHIFIFWPKWIRQIICKHRSY